MKIQDFVDLIILETVNSRGSYPHSIQLPFNELDDLCRYIMGKPINAMGTPYFIYGGVEIELLSLQWIQTTVHVKFSKIFGDYTNFDWNYYKNIQGHVNLLIPSTGIASSLGGPRVSGVSYNYHPTGQAVKVTGTYPTPPKAIPDPYSIIPNSLTLSGTGKYTEKLGHCSHRWKLYNGFTQSYEFCETCDAKRDI